MKKTGMILVCIISIAFGRSLEELQRLYENREYTRLIHTADSLLASGVDSAWVKAFEGRAYADLNQDDRALPYLKSVYESPQNIPKWMWAWNTFYLAKAYLYKNESDKANTLFKEVIKAGTTKNVVANAKKFMNLTSDSPLYKRWMRIETPNFNFLFHKRTKLRSPQQFAQMMQLAFDTINTFFNAEIPGKIDFFVWNKYVRFPDNPKFPGGFAIPELLIVHTRYMQTRGHEMTHIIAHHAVDTVHHVSAFINEGVATHFNLTHMNEYEAVRKYLPDKALSIEKLWKSSQAFRELSPALSYSLAAAFIHHLLDEGGKENFLMLLADQSWDNAQNIYGDKLTEIIDGFWKRVR